MRSRGKKRKLGGSTNEKFPLRCRSGVLLWEVGALRDSQREDEEIIVIIIIMIIIYMRPRKEAILRGGLVIDCRPIFPTTRCSSTLLSVEYMIYIIIIYYYF